MAHGDAGRIGFANGGDQLFGVRKGREGGGELVHRRMVQDDAADRPLASGVLGAHVDVQGEGLMGAVEIPDVVDLGEIVILSREPENWNGGNSAAGEVASHVGGGDRFVNGVGGTGKQADLLAGDDGDGAGAGEKVERSTGSVLSGQGGDQGGAAIVGIIQLAGGGGDGFRIVRIMPVETGNAIKMICEIGEKLGGAGDFGMTNTGRFHVWL